MSRHDQWLLHSPQHKNAVLSEPIGQYVLPAVNSDTASLLSGSGSSIYAESIAGVPSMSGTSRMRAAPAITSGLKTAHTYTGANDTLFVQLQTPPQTSPTFMGGSKQRGNGAVTGRVILRCTEKLKATELRLKLKCVVAIMAPRASQATNGNNTNFSGLTPSSTSTSSREQVLVQLDHRFLPSNAKYSVSKDAASTNNTTGRLDRKGYYEWDFRIDIPERGTTKGWRSNEFPGIGSYYPSSYVLESEKNKVGKSEEWASVKWYLKFTVERPGLFRTNDRVLIPFIYLPPPPENVSSLLIRRQALSSQTQNLVSTISGPVILPKSLAEPASSWKTYYFPLSQLALGQPIKRSLVDKMFGSKKPKEERWGISFPGNPMATFPLRSVVPFVLTLVHSAGIPLVVHPCVSLVQKVQLRGRHVASHIQTIAHAKVFPSPLNKSGMQQWFGHVQFPKWCSPSFETALLGLEYYIQVKPLNAPEAHVLQTIPLGLYCMPPRLMQTLRSSTITQSISQAPSRRGSTVTDISSGGIANSGSTPRRRVPPVPSTPSPSTTLIPSGMTPMPVPHVPAAMPAQDPHAAGMAGIGRSHLLEARVDGQTSGMPLPVESRPSLPASALASQQTQQDQALEPTTTRANLPNFDGEEQSRDTQPIYPQLTETTGDTVSVQGPHINEDASLHEGTQPMIPDDASSDGLVHDAGPLTQEQENAWTMDILANAINEDDVAAGFDLPPSYFEATGILDHEES